LKATLPGKASRPDVSLIVVAWNVAPYIAQALNSAAQQDLPGLEIIVVENNSTDGTRHIIEGYAHYKNFHCVYNDSNVGLGPARNQGMQLATGEYVAFLDGDDWLEPDAIRLSYEAARKNKSEIVYFGWNRVYPSGRSISMPPEDAKLVGSIDTADDRGVLLQYFQTAWNKLYSKRFLTEVGVSFEDAYYEDIPWSYSLLCQARSVFVLRKSLYNYRQRDGSILTTKDTKHFDAIKMWLQVANFLDANPRAGQFRHNVALAAVNQLGRVLWARRIPWWDYHRFSKTLVPVFRRLGTSTTMQRHESALAAGDLAGFLFWRMIAHIKSYAWFNSKK
jgi:glycosyltransferase involved in cell wall biosynthesis